MNLNKQPTKTTELDMRRIILEVFKELGVKQQSSTSIATANVEKVNSTPVSAAKVEKVEVPNNNQPNRQVIMKTKLATSLFQDDNEFSLSELKSDKITMETVRNPELIPKYSGKDLASFFIDEILTYARDNAQTSGIQVSKWLHLALSLHIPRGRLERIMFGILRKTRDISVVEFLKLIWSEVRPAAYYLEVAKAKRNLHETFEECVERYAKIAEFTGNDLNWERMWSFLAENDNHSGIGIKIREKNPALKSRQI